jgi:TRAP-type C4-dicarboxylate transport system permease small subunit
MIARVYEGLLKLFAYGAVAVLFAVMLAIGLDVGARYFLGAPIGWVFEFVQHGMLLMLFLGLGWVTRAREHVAVEILVDAVPPVPRRGMLVFANLASAGICAFVGAWAAAGAFDNFRRGVLTDGIYPIPRGWLITAIAIGFFFATVEFLRIVLQLVRREYSVLRSGDAEFESLRKQEDAVRAAGKAA